MISLCKHLVIVIQSVLLRQILILQLKEGCKVCEIIIKALWYSANSSLLTPWPRPKKGSRKGTKFNIEKKSQEKCF